MLAAAAQRRRSSRAALNFSQADIQKIAHLRASEPVIAALWHCDIDGCLLVALDLDCRLRLQYGFQQRQYLLSGVRIDFFVYCLPDHLLLRYGFGVDVFNQCDLNGPAIVYYLLYSKLVCL